MAWRWRNSTCPRHRALPALQSFLLKLITLKGYGGGYWKADLSQRFWCGMSFSLVLTLCVKRQKLGQRLAYSKNMAGWWHWRPEPLSVVLPARRRGGCSGEAECIWWRTCTKSARLRHSRHCSMPKGDPKAAPCLLKWSSEPVFDVEHHV